MTGEINRVPVGLLSLLDMKARGQAPRALSGEVQAELDILRIYLENDRVLERTSASIGAAGVSVLPALTVLQNENWYVHGFYLQSGALAAGTTVTVAPAIQRVDNFSNNTMWLQIGPQITATVGQWIFGGVTFTTPYIARPGDVFAIVASSVTLGTAPSVAASLDYSIVRF